MAEVCDENLISFVETMLTNCETADSHAELAARIKREHDYLLGCDPSGQDIPWLRKAYELLMRAAALRAGIGSGSAYDEALAKAIDRYVIGD